ncbi:uncharacterized protein [Dermacentor albipictus]|uniref:uncharacterized protein n=1 Tax=Dermacentor albipictus TaxID=60249 RepID=UPI0038FCB6A1
MERSEEESESKLHQSTDDQCIVQSSNASEDPETPWKYRRHGSDRMAPQRTMRLIPVRDDGRLSASGSHSAQFSLDEESLVGTVSAPSEGEWPRPRKPSAYYLCMQRCTILATMCLVILAFGAVITGVSKKKSHHALFYIEVRHTTERTEATVAPDHTVVKGGDRRRALNYDTTEGNDTVPGGMPLLRNETRLDVDEESE